SFSTVRFADITVLNSLKMTYTESTWPWEYKSLTRFEISRTVANSTRDSTLMYSAMRLNPAFLKASRPFFPRGMIESSRPLLARVICWVFFTERMCRRKSRSVGMAAGQSKSLIRGDGRGHREALLERVHGFLDFRFDAVVKRFFRGDILQQGRIIRLCELQKLAFESPHFRHGQGVERAAGSHLDDQHLFLGRERHELILLQNFRQPLPARQLPLGRVVQ